MIVTLYTVVMEKDLDHLNKIGFLPIAKTEDAAEALMESWMERQLQNKLPIKQRVDGYHWCFTNLDQVTTNKDEVIVEFKTDTSFILLFDDNDYIQIANNVMNKEVYTYLAHSEKEAIENSSANREEILRSWEKMFDIRLQKRDPAYCGSIQLRAVVPYIHRSMITLIRNAF